MVYRRAKERAKASRLHSTTKKSAKGNRTLHGIVIPDSAQTEPVRIEPPDESLRSPPSLSNIDTFSFTLSPPGSPIITDNTFSLCADNKPPLDSSYLLPNTRSGSGWGLEDVSSLCNGPLPVINTQMEHIHSIDPFIPQDSIVDGLLTLNSKATGIYGGSIEASELSESYNAQLS